MPYNPSEQFDHRQIFAGIAGAGNSIGNDIAEAKKKREFLEQQNAFNQTVFGTVSSVLTEEEKQKFLSGNINAQNGIITAAGARMMQKFQNQKAQEDQQRWQMEQALKLRIAEMSHAPQPLQPPVADPNTGMLWNGRQWVQPPGAKNDDKWSENMATRRGELKSDGTLEGKDEGEMVEVVTPNGKTIIMPWKVWEGRTKPQQQGSSPSAPQAAGGTDLKVLAQKALDDPNASEAHKAAARKILGK